jgi:Flp pilus assembly protein CpaB
MTYRVRNIGIAIALALVAGFLTVFYVTNQKRSVIDAESDVTVWVAARDIPAGTPGTEVVDGKFLEEQDVAKKSVAPGAISNPEQIEEQITASTIYAGEQITTRRFTTEEAKGIRGQLAGNQRALQVSGNQHQLLAGTLKEGDRVDVVGAWKPTDGGVYSRVILRDILVLKAAPRPTSSQKLTAGPRSSALSVMLRLTDAQSQKLFWMMEEGKWSLELRPTDEPADSAESADNGATILMDGMTVGQLRAAIRANEFLLNQRRDD